MRSAFGSNGLQLSLLSHEESQDLLSVNNQVPHAETRPGRMMICLDIFSQYSARIFLASIREHNPNSFTSDRMGTFRRLAFTELQSSPRMNIPLSMKRRTISVSQVVISTSGRPMKFKFSSSIFGEEKLSRLLFFNPMARIAT